MPYPTEFYRSETTSATGYQKRQSSNISLSRIIRGKLDYWISPLPIKTMKKKTLIIADWSSITWSVEKYEKVKCVLDQLLDDGFELWIAYLRGDGVTLTEISLTRVTKDFLRGNFFSNGDLLPFHSPSTLTIAIAQAAETKLALSPEKFQVLDDYWLDKLLLSAPPLDKPYISLSAILNAQKARSSVSLGMFAPFHHSESLREHIIDLKYLVETCTSFITTLSQAKPERKSIIIDEFSIDAYNVWQMYSTKQENKLPIVTCYKYVELSIFMIEKIIHGPIVFSETFQLKLGDLSNVEQLRLRQSYYTHRMPNAGLVTSLENTQMPDIQLASFLRYAPNLKQLQLHKIKHFITIGLDSKSLLKLEELTMDMVETTILDNLSSISNAAPNLKHLYLLECSDLGKKEHEDDSELSLLKLETLFLESCKITPTKLGKILSSTCNLRKLRIIGKFGEEEKEEEEEYLNLKEVNLTMLEELYLTLKELTEKSLFQIIKSTSHLKVIRLDNVPISRESLHFLLKNNSNIEHLELINYSISLNNYDELKLSKGCLPRLKILRVGCRDFPKDDIDSLLNAAPNLKAISLSFCNFNSDLDLLPGALSKLIGLDLRLSSISIENLRSFLIAAPHLKYIHLDYCDSIPPIIRNAATQGVLTAENLDCLLDGTWKKKGVAFKEQPPIYFTPPAPASIVRPPQAAISCEQLTGRATEYVHTVPVFPTKSPSHKQSLDADTTYNPRKVLYARHLFSALDGGAHPVLNNYRLDVYQVAKVTEEHCTLQHAFSLQKEGDLKLSPITFKTPAEITEITDGRLFCGQQTLRLSTEWQALASLSPLEKMLGYSTSPKASVEIQYSARDNLYYIRSDKQNTVDITFAVHVPEKTATIPTDINRLIAKYLEFKAEPLEITQGDKTGSDYLNAIISQQKGACRHRSFAFMKEMAETHPQIPVRIINNDVHSYVEVHIEDQWIGCDLGGYSAELKIEQPTIPTPTRDDLLQSFIKPEEIITAINIVEAAQQQVKPEEPAANPDETVARSEELETSRESKQDEPTNTGLSIADIRERLSTWEETTSGIEGIAQYCQSYVSGTAKKRLIECENAEDTDALHFALQAYCREVRHPVFYVHSADDLICAAPSIDASGHLRPGPSGPLHDFLTKHENGVVIVNYANFTPEELVRFNSFIDAERKTDITKVPDDMVIIGLWNIDTPHPAPGRDFYSRFDKVETCPIPSASLRELTPLLPEVATTEPPCGAAADAYDTINLYHALDWECFLLGRWVPNCATWHYEEGALIQLLKSGVKTIEIQNGLWDDADFCRFWREAAQKKMINYPGGTIALTEDVRFKQREGYNWGQFISAITQAPLATSTPSFVLNQATFSDFFNQYAVSDDKQLQNTDGHIKALGRQQPALLSVHLTHTLTDDQWAMLLNECLTHRVKLTVSCAPDILLPQELIGTIPENHTHIEPIAALPLPDVPMAIIQSNDVDTTVIMLCKNESQSLVLDVSELDDNDLITRFSGGLINRDDEPLRFEFKRVHCAVKLALEKTPHTPVILKGRISPELAQQLAPLLLNHPYIKVVSTDVSEFGYLPHHIHTATTADKRALLEEKFATEFIASIEQHIEAEPLSKLIARCRFLQSARLGTSDLNWQGLDRVSAFNNDPGEFFLSGTRDVDIAFTQGRIFAVNAALAQTPYVFLAGLSGVGKSTFVTKELCQTNDKLYQGESAMQSWAENSTSGVRKLLFIDEANLSTSEWSAFEGLFDTPPGILIEGKYYPLSTEHQVIFAGNPLSYGDERTIAPLFERHGNTVLFDPLPSAVLFERILKPVFEETALETQATSISSHLLAVYRFLCQCSTTDILISPRELQMMALLTLSYCEQPNTIEHVDDIAKHFAYTLAKHLVPEAKKAEFARLFKPTRILTGSTPAQHNDYLITPSRQPVYQLLDDFLNLQNIRHQRGDEVSNTEQKYGGLGGIIIEGEPGIGKSELVTAALLAHHYEEMDNLTEPATCEKPFYRMPVSMALAEKEALLLKAFHEGAVVVIDEINSSPTMERLLNALLMGTTPEGEPAKKPGFMIIGTQNPVTMAGRRAASTALSRRMTQTEFPPYTTNEIRDILLGKGLLENTATHLAEIYQSQVEHAKAHHLSPAPTFRDLLRLAEQIRTGELTVNLPQLPAPAVIKIPEQHAEQTPISLDRASSDNQQTPPRDTMSSLMTTYFGSSPQEPGLFAACINQHRKAHWFQNLCAYYICCCFNARDYKTESDKLPIFVEDLRQIANRFEAEPTEQGMEEIQTKILQGRRQFPHKGAKQGDLYNSSPEGTLEQFQLKFTSLATLIPPAPRATTL